MSNYVNVIKKQKNPNIESLRDDILARKDPDFFWFTGTQVYCGRQGSGKTVSAVKHVTDLKNRYPKCIIVSNLQLNNLQPVSFDTSLQLQQQLSNLDTTSQYIFFSSAKELAIVLTQVNNGFLGVVYLIDEIHTYFNALDSKDIPPYVFTEISQQRKQRKLIIGTSQLFLRMAKPLREQCDNLIVCNTIAGFITIQRAYDGMSITQDYDGKLSGNQKKVGWFFHSRKIRNSFDTFQKIQSGSVQFEEITQVSLQPEKKGKFAFGSR